MNSTIIRAKVVHLLSLFSKIPEPQIADTDPLIRYFGNNAYAKLLFGAHMKGIFPLIDQTSFTNSLFSASLDQVSEVVTYIKNIYPDGSFYQTDVLVSAEKINDEFNRMQSEISNLL